MKTSPNDPVSWSQFIKSQASIDGAYYEGQLPGLTKREYFASLAMQGMLANSYNDGANQPMSTATAKQLSKMAVEQADALIEALREES